MGRTMEVVFADTVGGLADHNRFTMWRQGGAVINIVHAFETGTLGAVDFQNHLICLFYPGLVVANG